MAALKAPAAIHGKSSPTYVSPLRTRRKTAHDTRNARHSGHETSPVVDGHASPLPPDGRGSPEPRDHPEGEEEHAHLERPDGPLAEETRPRREREKMGGGAREKTHRGQPHGDHGSARTTAHSWQPGERTLLSLPHGSLHRPILVQHHRHSHLPPRRRPRLLRLAAVRSGRPRDPRA